MLKILGISRGRSTTEIDDIFKTKDKIFLVFIEMKVNLLLFFPLRGKIVFSASITDIKCKRNLHLENGSSCHLNEWIKINLWFKKAA